MDEVSKIRGIKYAETWDQVLFALPPFKIPGYAPADR